MDTVTNTRLWKTTLANNPTDDPATTLARDKLRVSFISFRERAGLMAAEIHRYLPEFTVHDISHLDALWEIADIIAGEGFSLTPTEGFLLGGAFLLHDLGMSLAAYPKGIEELKQGPTWNDIITLQFMEKNNRQPTAAELAAPTPEAVTSATAYLLRALHAKQAKRLGLAAWTFTGTDSQQYLIENTDVRQSFGEIVGVIAHSHWFSVREVEVEFPQTLGAPHWCPRDWTINPLKLACLLRLADAGHIDARRAPYFLRAIRHISATPADYWSFQQRLNKPHLSGDALCYTSSYAFRFEESASWWLCLDTLHMIDDELRAVDALLADKGINRFAARRVAGTESSERLISYIPTEGWAPVDAFVQVSDVPRLLTCLGGKELYGQDMRVPLRELIQNSADALRARWAFESRPEGWGQVTVRLGEDGEKHWLEVEDNGIGMSSTVLTKYLLDFGTSFWGSSAMIDELPGLLGSGFRPTGKYGIGFFSIFMLGDSVRIRTRRADAAQKDTLVLEFNTGLSSRPILREAANDEVLVDGGTCIRVWLRVAPIEEGGLLYKSRGIPPISLAQLCKEVCLALPVTLICHQNSSTTPVVKGSDWLDCPGEELLNRTYDWATYDAEDSSGDAYRDLIAKASENLRVLREADGTAVGRACIVPGKGMQAFNMQIARLNGVVTIGGLAACRLYGISGVLAGTSERVVRDTAIPVVSFPTLSAWATEQASLVAALYEDPKDQMHCAGIVRRCGGNTLDLPVARYGGSYVSIKQIAHMSLPNEVMIAPTIMCFDIEVLPGFKPCPDIFIVGTFSILPDVERSHNDRWPHNPIAHRDWGSILLEHCGGVVEAVAQAWGSPIEEVVRQVMDLKSALSAERIIGHNNSQEIKTHVLVLDRV